MNELMNFLYVALNIAVKALNMSACSFLNNTVLSIDISVTELFPTGGYHFTFYKALENTMAEWSF